MLVTILFLQCTCSYTTQEYLAHHTRIYLPKWNQCTKVESVSTTKWNQQSEISEVESVSTPKCNQCPHQSGISKVESVSTPKWNQCPHQNGISTPPECNVYTITKFKQYTIILTLISLHSWGGGGGGGGATGFQFK